MRDTQPPITNEEEFHGYQLACETLTRVLEEREDRLLAARTSGAEPKRIESLRYDLLQVLRHRQGILDAIRAYELKQHRHQSA